MTACFHCGEFAGTADAPIGVIGADRRRFCCHGCLAVAEAIAQAGLADFYRLRSQPTSPPLSLAASPDFACFDETDWQSRFVTTDTEGRKRASFLVETIDCSACGWLIENRLSSVAGVVTARVDATSKRLDLAWSDVALSTLAAAVAEIGHKIRPEGPSEALDLAESSFKRTRFTAFVAILCAFWAMMATLPIYLAAGTMDLSSTRIFQSMAMVIALVSMGFSARDWMIAGFRDASSGRLTVNLSLTVAIVVLFVASAVSLFGGTADCYFDSVAMLIAFLSVSRWITARLSLDIEAIRSKGLSTLLKAVWRVDAEGKKTLLPIDRLIVGDKILFERGDSLVADGRLLSDRALVDEAMLTGEAMAVTKSAGDPLLAGSRNLGDPVEISLDRVPDASWIAEIRRQMRGLTETRTPVLLNLDRVARFLLPAVAVLAAIALLIEWGSGPERAMMSALAVFVVTCPCALALALPLAISAAQAALLREGVVLRRPAALDAAPKVTDVAFDKTGTLTTGQLQVDFVTPLAELSTDDVVAIAAAMSGSSRHPVSRAIRAFHRGEGSSLDVVSIAEAWGEGIETEILGPGGPKSYRLGAIDFVTAWHDGRDLRINRLRVDADRVVWLADDRRLLGLFAFSDPLRKGAVELISSLSAKKTLHLVSGDHKEAVDRLADRLGVDSRLDRVRPDEKLDWLVARQKTGRVVAVVGDGVNDGPILAAADLSVSLSQASDIARSQADVTLIGNDIGKLSALFDVAGLFHRIVRQNVGWAIAYNVAAIPLAMVGLVTPGVAGIGMAVSSTIVTLNSARLLRWKKRR